MSKKIIEMVNEGDYVSLKPVLEEMVAKKIVEKIGKKKEEFIADLKEKRAGKKG